MPSIKLKPAGSTRKHISQTSGEITYPGNVWVSNDQNEVIVTNGNITFHEGREFYAGIPAEKSDLDCALKAFQKGFNGYYKKNN